ncbi:MAG TPA: LysE family translocator [Acidimicrobiales bacterium]|nr:LysE family translocator [Acidimicrobiales bacterium]
MPTLSSFALFALAALALLAVPGPSVLYIITRSIEQGRRAGLVSVLGIHTGSLVHVAAAAVGVSTVLAASAAAFTTVKLLGAGYLVFIGVRKLLAASRADGAHEGVADDPEPPRVGLRRVYGQGVVVNVLNPKTALFFLAFLPQFTDPGRGPVAAQVVVLGLCFIALGMCSDGTYALVAGALGNRLRNNQRFARRRDQVSGVVYVGLGLTAALAGHPARRAA